MPKPPKRKCCESTPRCKRCPLRMLKEGTLPAEYTVKKRRLVMADGSPLPKKDKKKKGKKKKKKARAEKKAAKASAALVS